MVSVTVAVEDKIYAPPAYLLIRCEWVQNGYGELPRVCKTWQVLVAWEWVGGDLGVNECGH